MLINVKKFPVIGNKRDSATNIFITLTLYSTSVSGVYLEVDFLSLKLNVICWFLYYTLCCSCWRWLNKWTEWKVRSLSPISNRGRISANHRAGEGKEGRKGCCVVALVMCIHEYGERRNEGRYGYVWLLSSNKQSFSRSVWI